VKTLKADRILVAFDQFLRPEELDFVRTFATEMEYQFSAATTVHKGRPGTLDVTRRRARVLTGLEAQDIGRFFKAKVAETLPSVLEDLELPMRPTGRTSVQITSTGDGEYYKPHVDNSPEAVERRELSFVYFCHSHPRKFEGGELRIYATRLYTGIQDPDVRVHVISPEANRMVFFQGDFLHEICPVVCHSNRLVDTRLTVNGWVYLE
jgi:Rps23 Pro-64 3,4-dihydroxylase Tpa1-like proline 4-hydroxylase